MLARLTRRAAVLTVLALGAAVGCGGKQEEVKKIAIRGKIMNGDKSWTYDSGKGPKLPPGVSAPPVGPGQSSAPISIGFHPTSGGDFVSGSLDATTGTFQASGLQPGQYKISLELNPTATLPGARDPFGGRFTKEQTQIVRELTKDGEEVVIDVSKPKG